MLRRTILTLLGCLLIAGTVSAQAPARLRWQAGQVLIYKVEQTIAITEIVGALGSVVKFEHGKAVAWRKVLTE